MDDMVAAPAVHPVYAVGVGMTCPRVQHFLNMRFATLTTAPDGHHRRRVTSQKLLHLRCCSHAAYFELSPRFRVKEENNTLPDGFTAARICHCQRIRTRGCCACNTGKIAPSHARDTCAQSLLLVDAFPPPPSGRWSSVFLDNGQPSVPVVPSKIGGLSPNPTNLPARRARCALSSFSAFPRTVVIAATTLVRRSIASWMISAAHFDSCIMLSSPKNISSIASRTFIDRQRHLSCLPTRAIFASNAKAAHGRIDRMDRQFLLTCQANGIML